MCVCVSVCEIALCNVYRTVCYTELYLNYIGLCELYVICIEHYVCYTGLDVEHMFTLCKVLSEAKRA